MQNRANIHGTTSTQHYPAQSADVSSANLIVNSLAIALPVLIIGGIASYRKYRAVVVRRQIQRLNKIWQLNSSEALS